MSSDRSANIVLLLPDQWRGDCLGHLDHPDIRTPWADQLAAEGTSHTRAFSPAPTCIPARMALLTGQAPWVNGRTGYEEAVPWHPPHTLPGLLRDAGYQTMQVGKTHFHPMRAHLGYEINDIYEASVREAGFVSDYHAELARFLPSAEDAALRRHPNAWTVTPWTAAREWHCSEWITRRAIERLQRRDPQRPFFLQVGWHRPHPPFDPPLDLWQQWRERPVQPAVVGDWVGEGKGLSAAVVGTGHGWRLPAAQALEARRAYYASIEHVDEQLGRLLWALRQLDLEDDTWVVLTSDHGEFLGDHHAWHKNLPGAAATRIPLIVRPPPRLRQRPGDRDERPVLLSQVMPSCLAWAGLQRPPSCEIPLAEARADGWVHAEHHGHDRGWHALYDRRWAYHWHSDGTERLFDHSADPQELHDRATERPDERDRWRERLIALLARRGCGTSDGQRLRTGHHLGPTQPRSSP